MELKNQVKKYENWIIAFAAMGILAVFAGCRFDYFYDLNDDGYSGRGLYRHAGGA